MTYDDIAQAVKVAHLAAVLERKVECEPRNTLRLRARRDLQGLDDTGVALVLKARVLALRVLTNDGKINVVVASREARKRLAQHYGGVDVELLTHGDVP